MPITSVVSDPVTLTLTATGEYPVPLERLWRAWVDARQIERFWGPPQWPATFTRHEVRPGGRSEYHMTGPNGEISRGYWSFVAVDAPHGFEVVDGFATADGTPDDSLPGMRMVFRFEPTAAGSRFVARTTFGSVEAMERLLAMGMLEGLSAALAQLDAVLADLRELASGFTTALHVEDDTHVRVERDVRGPLALVWRAFHEAPLVRRWMLGPPGWTMPVCEVAAEVGGVYRYEWQNDADGSRFGFTGELLESEPPRRAVTTERLAGTEGPSTHNELLLSPLPGGCTRITLRITYPSKELRDHVLGTGMVHGMEASYARMEAEVLGG